MKRKLHAISAAALLACAAAGPVHAGLERVGPATSEASTAGGYPAWYQDTTGITLEFCDLTTQAEWDGGWCLLAPPDGPEGGLPEVFPGNFFDEHFFFAADNVLLDDGRGFRAKLVIALEGAFALEAPISGDQQVFARHRIDMRPLPFDGDYRVITPFSDVTYFDQKVGDRIFVTEDVGISCPPGNFECALGGKLGPFLLASATAGGAEVPPMPDLQSAPPGTDPFYDAMVALNGAPTPAPGTGKKYLADPARVGTVTGSPLPDVRTYDTDGTSTMRNHNTFRIEVRPSTPDRNAPVFYTLDGETNFTLAGRLMTGTLPSRVDVARANYRADAAGNATDVDVFATGNSTVQARIPGQPVQGKVKPTLAFWPEPCAGAVSLDATGNVVVNPGPYAAPAGAPTNLVSDDNSTDFWGQVALSTAAKPLTHVCVVDTSARNAAGQVEPTYMLRKLTDDVVVKTADFNGPVEGTLTVTAESSDPTAVLTLGGFGSTPDANGVYSGRGPGAQLTANSVKVKNLKSPPTQVQVASSKGGAGFHSVQTARGMAIATGQASASNVSATVSEDCATTAATSCAAGQSLVIDLLANTTFQGQPLRQQVASNAASVVVTVVQNARLGVATVSPDGMLTFVPNANASGTDAVGFTVAVNGGTPSAPATANIAVTQVNDLPVAGNTTANAVQAVVNTMNLMATSTDPDGIADVKNVMITSWPPELGSQPVPVNGTIRFTPSLTGNFNIGYVAIDGAGAQSANTGTGAVTVIAGENIALTRAQFEAGKNRWRVDGTDTIRSSQTISITYGNGTIGIGPNAGKTCDGTAALPECLIGTTGVTATGAFSLDQSFGTNSFQNPATAGGWSVAPTRVRAWSSNPVLGGDATLTINRK